MMVYNKGTRARLLATSVLCGAAVIAIGAPGGPARAQSTAHGVEAPTEVQEIVVTGSRIPQQGLASVSPLTVVNDQEVKAQGTVNVETLMNNLPSVLSDQGKSTDNGADGTASVNLRGLTTNRTLVLVDGIRLTPNTTVNGGTSITADLNNIPAALVQRVEVVTGGASAVYGSDAVAGVVNFILRKNFAGLEIDAQAGFAQHENHNDAAQAEIAAYNAAHPTGQIHYPGSVTDGRTSTVTILAGLNAPDGQGNFTAYASYQHMDPVPQSQRDFGACGISTILGPPDRHVCQGSSNSAYGHFFDFGVADNPNGTNTFVPYSGTLAFNFAPYNFYQVDDTRYSAGYFATYRISDAINVYSNLMFMDDRSSGNAAPSGLFNSGAFTINCDNPLASASQLQTLCGANAGVAGKSVTSSIGYRLVGQPRITTIGHTDYRLVLGSKGDLGEGWNYDAYLQYGHTGANYQITGDFSIRKINEALNVVNGPNGAPVCASGVSGCVPLNIFRAQSVDINAQALAFISSHGQKVGGTTEQVASASLTGDLGQYGVKSPWANTGLGVALGAEYRREALSLTVDEEYASGDLIGTGGVSPPANGAFDVYELYGEARVPLIQDKPFVKSLNLEAGYRYSSYSSAGSTNTYKISLDYQPIDDFRVRGGYNRAVRAPNIAELFQPDIIQNSSYSDPCSGGNLGQASSPTFAQCARTGVTQAQYTNRSIPDCASGQCSTETGGNVNLKPEEADTYTLGVVFTPTFIRGLTGTLDYYYIDIKDPIVAGIGPTVVLAQCLSGGQFCDQVHRNPTTGNLTGLTLADGYVVNTSLNSGSIKTRGLDMTVNYRFDLPEVGGIGGLGSVNFNYVGTLVDEFLTEPVKGIGHYDCNGRFGTVCGVPAPKYRHELRATWNTPWYGATLSANWRYVGEVTLDNNSENPFLHGSATGGQADLIDGRLPAYSYIDLSGTMKIGDRVRLRAGVNNVFDKDPPIVDASHFAIAGAAFFGNGNTFPGVYDSLGRTVFFGLNADF